MRRRIVLVYLVLTVLASSLVAFISYRYSSEAYIAEIKTGLKHEAILSARIIKSVYKQEDITDQFLKELSLQFTSLDGQNDRNHAARRITLIAKDGTVFADSEADSKKMENHIGRTEVAEALKSGIGIDIRRSATTGGRFLYLAYYSKELDQIIRMAASVEHINDIRNTILFYSIIAVLGGMVLSSLMALSLSGYVTRPVARLVREYGKYLPEKMQVFGRTDEIGQLSSTLSSMTEQIESIIKELKDRNAKVDTIISSMENGLIAVDRTMRIIILNPVANRLFGIQDKQNPAGVPLVQVIRNRRINDLLQKAIRTNEVYHDEIHIYQGGKRILAIHISPIYPMEGESVNSGALAFINDITQVRKLEEMRSEFVSNVTHELKTPLTSIRGFVETLKNGAIHDKGVAEKFLDIIDLEADRLSSLINDILELSEIESMKHDLEITGFKLLPLVKEVESMLINAASEKGVSLDVHMDPEISVEANRHRIKQLLINLMDNAVKYNIRGGAVSVWAESSKGRVEIHVKDTGIGIPRGQISRIFERFYRVDKGRSREMGGTGLGLSIVKHIAQLYGGTVRVESEEGKGSEFIVTLPIRE